MDSKKVIGDRLKEARERAGISIQDIATATRINTKFLKAIEEGESPEVPTTYLRAFLRAFAEHAGLDPKEILEEYFKVEPPPPPVEERPERPIAHEQPAPVKVAPPKPQQSTAQRQVKVLFVISAAMVATLAILIFVVRNGRPEQQTQEIPFQDVVKDREAKQSPPPPRVDSAALRKAAQRPVQSDSLRLEAVASESVWVHIVIDNAVTREYLLTPKRRLQWRAKTTFLISIGNVSALSLTLNGVKLDALGEEGKPVTNVLLSRESMKQFVREPPKKDQG